MCTDHPDCAEILKTAEKTFARYKKCTDIYCALFAEGRSIERLTVNVA